MKQRACLFEAALQPAAGTSTQPPHAIGGPFAARTTPCTRNWSCIDSVFRFCASSPPRVLRSLVDCVEIVGYKCLWDSLHSPPPTEPPPKHCDMSGFYTWRLNDPIESTSDTNSTRSNSRSRRQKTTPDPPGSGAVRLSSHRYLSCLVPRVHSTYGQPAPSKPFNITPGWSTNSPSFGPTFEVSGILPDLTIVTGDRVCFYAHSRFLLHSSTNAFGGLLGSSSTQASIDVPEAGAALHVALHAIYRMSCIHLSPSLENIEGAINALFKYGVDARALATPHSPHFQLVLTHAPHAPIEAYALAGQFRMETLAVAVSAHLLAYDTSRISDALAAQMGPLYLKRLLDFHQARLAALKDIVLSPPKGHPPTARCGDSGRRSALAQAWAYAAAGIVWEAAPGMYQSRLRVITFTRALFRS